ncbi:hypothetical protein B0H19DRAFT_1083918 [Mycena capillaripes]|nr:hypothetical protein B0H19DRAFT_1083918 [Mycena capillaripes]
MEMYTGKVETTTDEIDRKKIVLPSPQTPADEGSSRIAGTEEIGAREQGNANRRRLVLHQSSPVLYYNGIGLEFPQANGQGGDAETGRVKKTLNFARLKRVSLIKGGELARGRIGRGFHPLSRRVFDGHKLSCDGTARSTARPLFQAGRRPWTGPVIRS